MTASDIKIDEIVYTINLELRIPYTLGQLIILFEQAGLKIRKYGLKNLPKVMVVSPDDEVKGYYQDYDYAIYTVEDYPEITADMICYLERGCECYENGTEFYPDFVTTQKLYPWYLTEIYEDVVGNLLFQKELPTMDDYIFGLKYYLRYDAFYDFSC